MSALEDTLLRLIAASRLPAPVREYRFHPQRRWRFDFAWPDRQIALEVEGGVYVAGRHARGAGIEGDCEKYNSAAVRGWRVLRVTGKHIKNGAAMSWLEDILL